MRTLFQDIRFAIRMLIKNPGFTIPAVLCLSLGIGACTAVFSVVDTVLFRPLPFTDSERLVHISEHHQEKTRGIGAYALGVSPRLLFDMRKQIQSFEDIASFAYARFQLRGGEFPEQVDGFWVSSNLFGLLKVQPLLGRTFSPEEDQSEKDNIVIISHGLWQRRFGSDPNLVGKTITIGEQLSDDSVCTVVGIMPPGFQFYGVDGLRDIWRLGVFRQYDLENRTRRSLVTFARLKPDVTRKQAQAEAYLLAQRLAEQYPKTNEGWRILVSPLRDVLVRTEFRKSLWVLLGAVAFVLLIACANVANLILARASSRQKEVAIRATLGASRWRVIRQLLVESVLLALLGSGLGLLFTRWGIDLLKPLIPYSLSLVKDIGVDARILAFTLVILVITGMGCGLAPAWQLSKPNLTEALKEGGTRTVEVVGRRPLRDLLVVSQVALVLLLLIGAGLLIQTVVRLLHVDPGFKPRNLLEFSIELPWSYVGPRQITFYEQLLERMASLPGVQSVGTVYGGPGPQYIAEGQTTAVNVEDYACSAGTHDYFRTMGIPLLQGGYFTKKDLSGEGDKIIINEAAARRFWPNESPIGKRIRRGSDDSPWLEVIGVVATPKVWSYAHEATPQTYSPYRDSGPYVAHGVSFVVRTSTDPLHLTRAIRRQVQALDSNIPVGTFTKLEDRLRRSTEQQRLYMQLLTAFAVIGLVLAIAGIYGVISYFVAKRTHEIGIRMALGARPSDVLKLVIKNGMTLILAGLAIGVAAALALTRVLRSLLYGVTATDPVTFIAVCLLLTVVGLVSCYIPARRATKIDPMSSLRYE
jgi:putative ABC transport system permease protein